MKKQLFLLFLVMTMPALAQVAGPTGKDELRDAENDSVGFRAVEVEPGVELLAPLITDPKTTAASVSTYSEGGNPAMSYAAANFGKLGINDVRRHTTPGEVLKNVMEAPEGTETFVLGAYGSRGQSSFLDLHDPKKIDAFCAVIKAKGIRRVILASGSSSGGQEGRELMKRIALKSGAEVYGWTEVIWFSSDAITSMGKPIQMIVASPRSGEKSAPIPHNPSSRGATEAHVPRESETHEPSTRRAVNPVAAFGLAWDPGTKKLAPGYEPTEKPKAYVKDESNWRQVLCKPEKCLWVSKDNTEAVWVRTSHGKEAAKAAGPLKDGDRFLADPNGAWEVRWYKDHMEYKEKNDKEPKKLQFFRKKDGTVVAITPVGNGRQLYHEAQEGLKEAFKTAYKQNPEEMKGMLKYFVSGEKMPAPKKKLGGNSSSISHNNNNDGSSDDSVGGRKVAKGRFIQIANFCGACFNYKTYIWNKLGLRQGSHIPAGRYKVKINGEVTYIDVDRGTNSGSYPNDMGIRQVYVDQVN
ncbi:MAG: hypothetical protein HYR96_08285 [Deltaproteobacteria bacterium]|nr:hypothetical protein [Deltaproteobacteria bacterium]MBI3293505.1 hypothetical protein [Deltaproteobacteria bacterium]